MLHLILCHCHLSGGKFMSMVYTTYRGQGNMSSLFFKFLLECYILFYSLQQGVMIIIEKQGKMYLLFETFQ